jgi:hypothetical protein
LEEREIKIHRKIYQTKEQILMNFDFVTYRNGWNPIDEYFTTICGAFSYAMGAFPIDTTRITSSFDDNLFYSKRYGYRVIFPELSQLNEAITLSRFTLNNINGDINLEYNHIYASHDLDDNCTLMANNKNCDVEFDVSSNEVNNLSLETISQNILTSKWVISEDKLPNVSFAEAKVFLGDKFNSYLSTLASNVDESISVWNNQLNKYLDKATQIAESIKLHPFTEYCHKFVPITEPSTLYGKSHIRTQTGLKHDRFVEFYKLRLIHNIPKDLFRVLCQYWLQAEYQDAHNRLIQYTKHRSQIDVTVFNESKGWYIDNHDFIIHQPITNELHVIGVAPNRSIPIRELTADEVIIAEKIGFIVDRFDKGSW